MTAPSRQAEMLGIDAPGARDRAEFIAGAQEVQRDWISGVSGYGAIYADNPWRFATRSAKGRGRSADGQAYVAPAPLIDDEGGFAEDVNHYPTMAIDEMCAMQVGELAAPDSVLYFWGVFNMIPQALRVIEAWGFQQNTARVWVKTRKAGFDPKLTLDQNFPMGMGYIARGNPEILFIATRGSPRFKTAPRALIIAPRRSHSQKPDIVRRDIERQVDGPYLELFARTVPEGWDAFGNQLGKFESEEAA